MVKKRIINLCMKLSIDKKRFAGKLSFPAK